MYTDKQFGSLLNKLSPAEMHRLMNILRNELRIDISKSVVENKDNFSFSTKSGEFNKEVK